MCVDKSKAPEHVVLAPKFAKSFGFKKCPYEYPACGSNYDCKAAQRCNRYGKCKTKWGTTIPGTSIRFKNHNLKKRSTGYVCYPHCRTDSDCPDHYGEYCYKG